MRDLFSEFWNYPDTQKNGRNGQSQCGVDIWGQPDGGDDYVGVQCKGKNVGLGKKVTETELRDEIEKAKSFKPSLSKFYLVTTGPSDEKLERLAREITVEHKKSGLFKVLFWGWDKIESLYSRHMEVHRKHYPEFYITVESKSQKWAEMGYTIETEIIKIAGSLAYQAQQVHSSAHEIVSSKVIIAEHQAELEYAKELIDGLKPKTALDYLEKRKNRIFDRTTDPMVKYVFLRYLGAAHYQLNERENAGKDLIEALQYNSDDEKARCNAALGYLLLSDISECRKLLDSVLRKNRANTRAYSLLIYSYGEKEPFEAILERVPNPYQNDTEVAFNLANAAHERNLMDETEKWLRISIESDKKGWHEPRGLLGTILLAKYQSQNPLYSPGSQSPEEKKLVEESIALLTQAWEKVYGSEIKNQKLSWMVNRSSAKFILGEIDGAIKDIEVVLAEQPTNNAFQKQRGMYAIWVEDYSKALEIFKPLHDNRNDPESSFRFAFANFMSNNTLEALDVLKTMSIEHLSDFNNENIWSLKIELYLKLKQYDDANAIVEQGCQMEPMNPLVIATCSKVARLSGHEEEAERRIKEATQALGDDSPAHHRHLVAIELYKQGQWEAAANLMGFYVSTERYDDILSVYLECLHKAGKEKKALEICQKIRETHGLISPFAEVEASIYEGINDLQNAKNVYQGYLDRHGSNVKIEVHLALLNYRTEEFEEVDRFLGKTIDINDLGPQQLGHFAYLNLLRGNEKRAIEIIYRGRMKFFCDADAHRNYVNLFLKMEPKFHEWLEPKEVGLDVAILINADGNEQIWVIENRTKPDHLAKHLPPSHPLAQELMGKKVGDLVTLSRSEFSEKHGEIKEIKSKYAHAFQDAILNFETRFPGVLEMWAFPFKQTMEDGDVKTDFMPIFKTVERRSEMVKNAWEHYNAKKLTIGAFSHIVGRNEIEACHALISDSETGIFCATGSSVEREHAIEYLETKPRLIIDPIALLTLHHIGASETIVDKYGRPGIAQSTLDLIKESLAEIKFSKQEEMTITKEGDKFVKWIASEEDKKMYKEFLQERYSWCKSNCDILPCKNALDMNRKDRLSYEKIIGRASLDSILLAQEDGRILYSDDALLREIARRNFGVNGAWTQSILMHLLNNKALDIDSSVIFISKLIKSNYHHISVNTQVLLTGAEQSNWFGGEPFRILTKVLKAGYSDQFSSTRVAIEFLNQLKIQPNLTDIQRNFLIMGLLNGLLSGRDAHKTCFELKNSISEAPIIYFLIARRMKKNIDLWLLLNQNSQTNQKDSNGIE